ncbi:hypothetical protein [Bdellovibrio bacteriovorus]|uniref:Uncharacterized protein n=1 Tax=Bdellovibrio bacteriovorus str. Tiberius TaxID=1069642 RepID=K7ZEF6_BDEBC|nr:hypothetical protein [Bdellovibrio bacteriovorus]AFY00417.1 hypothetical protein Bdt_0710 [Bdellovibrio bacteriovorus str. Tiberius]
MDNVDRMDRMDKVRKGLKAADDMELPMNDDFFDRLHDKIMAEVEMVEIKPAPVLMTPRNLLRSHWRGWLYPVSGVASLMAFAVLLMPQVSKVNQSMTRAGLLSDGHERIVSEALLSPEEISQTLIITQSESDFFMDVARESFENLSVDKFNKIMGESGR